MGIVNAALCQVTIKGRVKMQVWLFLFCLIIVLHLQPSAALAVRSGRYNALADYTQQDIQAVIDNMYDKIDEDIEPGENYYPGIHKIVSWILPDGKIIVIRVMVWNEGSCNLAKGSENQYPVVPILGLDFQETLNDRLLPTLAGLMFQDDGYGIVVQDGVSVDYSLYTLPQMKMPPDNDPESHRHEELFEIMTPARPAALGGSRIRNRSMESSVMANNSSFSSFNISSNLTTRARAPQNGNGSLRIPTRANLTVTSVNNTFALPPNFHRKFPTTPEGDCDLPSLMLATAAGPFYDDEATHGFQLLNPTDKIWSPNARFYLIMQLDCNLVLYDIVAQTSLWASATDDQGNYCYASVSVYGELLVFEKDETEPLYRSRTWCSSNGGVCWTSIIVQVQDDGNLVLYIVDAGGVLFPIWDSDTVVCEGGCF